MNFELVTVDPNRNLALSISKLSLWRCPRVNWQSRRGGVEARASRDLLCLSPPPHPPRFLKAEDLVVFSQAYIGLTFLQSNRRETTGWKLEKNYWILFLDFPLFRSDFKSKYYFMFLLEFYLSING